MTRGRPPAENDEFAAMARRVMSAMIKRAANGDPEDLALVRQVIDSAEASLVIAVAGLREQGHSWTQVGEALGMTKQSAWERFSKSIPSGPPDERQENDDRRYAADPR